MIYLCAEVVSGLGEDTFWTWLKREVKNTSFDIPRVLKKEDVVLRYSTLGSTQFPDQTIGLLWELYPEMKEKLKSNQWDNTINKVYDCAKTCKYKTVASSLMVDYYKDYGKLDLIPIGINTDLFKPIPDKDVIRKKYNIPINKKVGFWGGTTHPMKGFDKVIEYKNSNSDIYWIIAWKQKGDDGYLPDASNFVHVSQQQLSELMACSDFCLSTSRLRPFYMVEWEAMACNLPMIILDNMNKDFSPSSSPREDIFRLKWDRISAKSLWVNYINDIIRVNTQR